MCLKLPNLIREILEDDVAFLVLELAETAHDQIANTNPNFLFHFTPDVSYAVDFIEALDEYSSVTEHLSGETVFESLVVLLSEELTLDWS